MTVNERKVRWPDGVSVSLPVPFGRVGGTYYWSPGAVDAPHFTVTRSFGLPGAGANVVFRRQGMTSSDTLGPGISGNVSTAFPSVSVNGTIPSDGSLIPRPWKSRVTTIEAGIGSPNASGAATTTYTPEQIAAHIFSPAAGPNDELSPFERAVRTGVGSVGATREAPVRYLGRSQQGPLGESMGDWPASTAPVEPWSRAGAAPPPRPGGLYGLMLDYLRDDHSSRR